MGLQRDGVGDGNLHYNVRRGVTIRDEFKDLFSNSKGPQWALKRPCLLGGAPPKVARGDRRVGSATCHSLGFFGHWHAVSAASRLP